MIGFKNNKARQTIKIKMPEGPSWVIHQLNAGISVDLVGVSVRG